MSLDPSAAAVPLRRPLRLALALALGLPLLACSGIQQAFDAGARQEAERAAKEARGFCTKAAPGAPREKIIALLKEVEGALNGGKLGAVQGSAVIGAIKGACEDGAVEAAEVDAARAIFMAAQG